MLIFINKVLTLNVQPRTEVQARLEAIRKLAERRAEGLKRVFLRVWEVELCLVLSRVEVGKHVWELRVKLRAFPHLGKGGWVAPGELTPGLI